MNFKKLGILTLITAFTCSSAGLMAQDEVIASDKRLDAEFEKYETFDWTSQVEGDADIFFLEDELLKAKVRDGIKFEMEAKGYDQTNYDPDLLVNFRVFDEEVTYNGYVNTFQDENYWGANELKKDAIGIVPDAEIREMEDQRKYFLEEGALLIQIVDTEAGEIIWQGYASGLMDGEIFDKDDERIKETIHRIFAEEYNWRSEV